MSKTRKTLASTYHYDPLDRLSSTNATQRFYNNTRIAMEIEGDRKTRFFEADSQPLALQQHGSAPGSTLLATDLQTSVLSGSGPDDNPHAQVYTPFGHHANDALLSVIGFNGERPEPVTGHYLLGQGYRAFNPVLMRFNSPDSWSPFGEGGINAYAYCDNEPVMRQDSTGHLWQWAKILGRGLGVVNTTERTNKKIVGLYGAVLKEIKELDTDFISALASANSTTTKTTKSVSGKVGKTISKSRSTLDKALKEIKKANKISSKKGTTTPERNFFSLPDSRRSREILNNPTLAYSTRNQVNMDSNIRFFVTRSRGVALEMLKSVERDLDLLMNARNIRA